MNVARRQSPASAKASRPAARAAAPAAVRDCGPSRAARVRKRGEGHLEARVVIAAGGTAGHVVPAIAVADALRAEGATPTFIGTRDRAEADARTRGGLRDRLPRARGAEPAQPAEGGPGGLPRGASGVGARQEGPARARGRRRPGREAATSPARWASRRSRLDLPLVLTEADSHLGLPTAGSPTARGASASRSRSRGARATPTSSPAARCPRAVLEADRWAARRRFGIPRGDQAITVFGGSLGARTVNEAAFAAFGGGRRPSPTTRPGGRGSSTSPGRRDYPELEERWALAGRPGALPAARVRALARRRARRLRPGHRPRGRIGDGDRSRRAARDPCPLSPCDRRPPDDQRPLDDLRRGRGDDPRLRARPRAAARRGDEILANDFRLGEMTSNSKRLAMPDAAERIAAEVLAAVGT